MVLKSLNVFIICTPNSDRKRILVDGLLRDPRVKLNEIPAIMIFDEASVRELSIEIDLELAEVIYGRRLLPGEIGCSMSHNTVRGLVSKGGTGGLVLEDDARISNVHELVTDAILFLQAFSSKSNILSFFDGNLNRSARSRTFENPAAWFNHSGPTPYALAYVVTPVAAQELLEKNTPLKFVPDWPASKVKYFLSSKVLVTHGDPETESTIDPTNLKRRNLSLGKRIQIITGIYYFLNFRKYGSYANYFNWMIVPRFWHRIARLRDIFKAKAI